jgi:hypothetical protein
VRKLFLIFGLLLSLLPHHVSAAEEFMLGAYRALALSGEAKLVDGTDYISFTGDFGFSGWLPTAEVIERHLAHESRLLSNFRLSIINVEFILPGLSGGALDSQIDTAAVDLLKQAGFDVVGRANNHALDQGPVGVRYNTTQWALAGLPTIGTRDSPAYVWETGGRRVVIYALTAYTDREDRERLVLRLDEADLAFLKQKIALADFHIAFLHLGSMSFFPSPHERKQVDRLLDAGADLVVCTGSHFIKGFVMERGKPVIYGIGNHLFSTVDRDTEPLGMHLIAGFRSGEFVQLFVVPFRNTIKEGNTGPLDEAAFRSFEKTILERSTTDSSRYFSDPQSLARLKDRLDKFSLSDLKQLRPRYFAYALFITYQHYPMIVVAGCLMILTLSVLLVRRMIRTRRQSIS